MKAILYRSTPVYLQQRTDLNTDEFDIISPTFKLLESQRSVTCFRKNIQFDKFIYLKKINTTAEKQGEIGRASSRERV